MNEYELERMVIRLIGDATSYRKMLGEAEGATKTVGRRLETEGRRAEVFGHTLSNLGTKMSTMAFQFGAMAALSSPFEQITRGVQLAADAEKMESAFSVLLKSKEAGAAMVAQLQQFAAETPLNMGEIQQFTKMLLSNKVAQEDIIPTLRMLGDVAMGDAQKMQRLTYAFGQIKTTGRLQGDELMQLVEAGFNPLQEMARTTGKSMEQLRAEMGQGKISFEMVAGAFKSASSAGGDFKDGMLEASKTISGLWSTMQDDIDAFQRSIGKAVIEGFHLKDMVRTVSSAAQELTAWFNELDPAVKNAIVSVVLLVAGIASMTIVWGVGAKVIGMVIGQLEYMVVTVQWVTRSLSMLALMGKAFGFLSAAFTLLISPLAIIKGLLLGIVTIVGLLLNPLVLIAAAIAVVGAAFVIQAGGIEEAWAQIKEAALEAWEWLMPVREAVLSLFQTIWTVAKQTWTQIKEFVTATWARIVASFSKGDIQANMEKVRDVVVDAVFFMEYSFLHFEKVALMSWELVKVGAQVAWKAVEFYSVLAMNLILENMFVILLAGVAGPGGLLFLLGDDFNATFMAIAARILDILYELIKKMVMWRAAMVAALIKGENPFKVLGTWWDMATKDFEVDMKGVKVKPLKDLEDKLRKEFEEAQVEALKKGKDILDPVMEDFEKWKAKRLLELRVKGEIPPELAPGLKKVADEAAKVAAAGADLGKFDQAVIGSAEAMFRMQEFRERMREGRDPLAGTGVVPMPGFRAPIMERAPAPGEIGGGAAGKDKALKVLEDIRELLRKDTTAGVTLIGAQLTA